MRSRFVYLMRHGEADTAGLLTSRGELQSRLAGERLAGAPLAAIWHSPQIRAASTAAIVAAQQSGTAAVPEDSPEHVLLVTHSFQVGWFVRDALDAPGAARRADQLQ